MCLYARVCMYVYVFIYMYTCVLYIYIHMHIYIYISIYYAIMYKQANICIRMYTCIYIYIHIHMYVVICVIDPAWLRGAAVRTSPASEQITPIRTYTGVYCFSFRG